MNCPSCNQPLTEGSPVCPHCGAATAPAAQPAAAATPGPPATAQKNKIAAGVLGILLGSLGIHKFYLGYTKQGIIMLLVSVLTFGLGGIIMGVIGLAEGIIYLTKADADFHDTYEAGCKPWF